MELQKLLKRLKNLDNNVDNAYKKDIKQVIETILKDYDVFYKNTSDKVSLDEFNDIFTEQEIPICLGISKNGNKCCRKPQLYSDYCKIHFYLEFNKKLNEKLSEKSNENNIIIINENNEKTNMEKTNMEKIFIKDSFYYKDNHFIYDVSDLNKVGYIENEEFFLTDDPFILGIESN